MHHALLVDEILQLIFEAILNDGKFSLCCVARCCRAWRDPALDRIWRRLPSAIPLLSLLPGFSLENGCIRLDSTMQDVALSTVFRSYAVRVKHIIYRHRMLTDPTNIHMDLFQHLINLESARIESNAAGEIAVHMSLAPRLRTLVLQTDYTKSNPTSTAVHSMLSLLKGCSSLEKLSIRGHSSECLRIPLSNITTLRSLSLHLSSLTEQSFMTVSTFPLLADFDVHADHLSYDNLSFAIAHAHAVPFFPALEKLKIRARPTLVALILHRLPRHTLCSLHVDAISPSSSSAFENLFDATSLFPLLEFILEDANEHEDIPAYTLDKFFTLDRLRPLSKLPLRRFVLDSSLPPDLSDPDIEEMANWWPFLERLELGARTALENVVTAWKPRSSLTSLYTLAKGCQHLKDLVIALDTSPFALPDPNLALLSFHPLVSLSISSRSRPDVPALSAILSRLFPSLEDATPGFVGEYADAWAALQATVSNPVHGHSELDIHHT